MFLEPAARLKSFDVMQDLDQGMGIFRPFSEPDRRNIIGLYDGEIRYTDDVFVKGIVQKLRDLGIYDRTLVILTSDHGEQFYDHGSWNHGNFLYDDALRVPLIVKFPGSRLRGRRMETPVRIVDLVPTILDELGIRPEKGAFDGESLLPLLDGRPEPPRRILADAIEENDDHGPGRIPRRIAISDGRLKVLFDQGFRPDYLKTLTVRPPDRKAIEAFDLVRDPGETTDVSAANAETIRRFRAEVEDLFRNAAPRQAKRSTMSADVERQLRALGYIR
jgi:arylsulfatase A-like enzyme